MPQIVSGEGYVYTYYPRIEPHTHQEQQHANVSHTVVSKPHPQGHSATLDVHNNLEDKAHLVLTGTLEEDEFYIRCINEMFTESEQNQFTIDSLGNLRAYSGYFGGNVFADNIDAMQETVDAHEDDLEEVLNIIDLASSTTETNGTLVKRDNTNGTEIDRVLCNTLAATGSAPNIAVYGDGVFSYVPQIEVNGEMVNKPNAVYRVGRNTEELSDLTGAGDGLEFKDNSNELRLEVQKDAPHIRMKGQKNAGVNWLECIDENEELQFAISKNGGLIGAHLTQDTVSELTDHEGHSILLGSDSLYIGPVRVSVRDSKVRFEILNTIPLVLQAAPYNINSSHLNGRDPEDLSARQWLVLARQQSGDSSIKARDIYTSSSEWTSVGQDYASDLSSDAQTQLDDLDGDIFNLQTDVTALQGAGGGTDLQITNTTGSASIVVEANTDVLEATVKIKLRAESSSNTDDREYTIGTDPAHGDDLIITCDTAANGLKEGWRFNGAGHVAFSGSATNPITNLNTAQFQVKGSSLFRDTLKVAKVCTFEDDVNIGVAGGSKMLTLNGSAIAPPTKILHSGSSSASASGNYVQLANAPDTRIVCGGLGSNSGTQSHRFYLPTNPTEGDQIQVTNRANAVYLRISSGSDQFISDGSTRVSATNKWILIQKYSTPPDYFTCITAMESLAADNVTIETTWVTSHGIIY